MDELIQRPPAFRDGYLISISVVCSTCFSLPPVPGTSLTRFIVINCSRASRLFPRVENNLRGVAKLADAALHKDLVARLNIHHRIDRRKNLFRFLRLTDRI